MFFQVDRVHKLCRDQLELTLKVLSATAGTTQAITNEAAEYSSKVLQQSVSVCEKLAAAKSMDDTIGAQSEHAKTTVEDFVAQSRRMSELYQNLAREAAHSLRQGAPAAEPT